MLTVCWHKQGVHEALAEDRLDVRSLRLLQPYQPSLSASWLFQRWVPPPLPLNSEAMHSGRTVSPRLPTEQRGHSAYPPAAQRKVAIPACMLTTVSSLPLKPQYILCASGRWRINRARCGGGSRRAAGKRRRAGCRRTTSTGDLFGAHYACIALLPQQSC